MTSSGRTGSAIDRLRSSFHGTLLEEADAGYDDARKVHNGLIDKRPSVSMSAR